MKLSSMFLLLVACLLASCAQSPNSAQRITSRVDSYTGDSYLYGPKLENMSPLAAGFSSSPWLTYHLKAVKKTGGNETPHVALSARVYGASGIGWSFPKRAYLVGGTVLPLEKGYSKVSGEGGVSETFIILISQSILNKGKSSGLRIRVDGRRSLFINLSPSYVTTFAERLSTF